MSSVHLQEALLLQFWCMLLAIVQLHATHIKTASAMLPEDGRLTPETCPEFKTIN
jgi:hypothetical protein